jgi:hypothetical protein
MRNVKAMMDFPFPVHPIPTLSLTQQFSKTLLQDTSPDAAQHILSTLPLQHDGVDALQMEQLGQQQSGGSATDDANLGFHVSLSPELQNNAITREIVGMGLHITLTQLK